LPIMPIPTWARYIIFTSLAPSPIAHVFFPPTNPFINSTNSAFCRGDDRYKMTESA